MLTLCRKKGKFVAMLKAKSKPMRAKAKKKEHPLQYSLDEFKVHLEEHEQSVRADQEENTAIANALNGSQIQEERKSEEDGWE